MSREGKIEFDSWKIFRIISEFVEGFEKMTDIGPSVSIFGSARVAKDHPYYAMSREVAFKIAKKGFGVITGGGPGLMEAANQGASEANGVSCGVSIDLPFEDEQNPYVQRRYRMKLRYFFVRKVMFLRYAQGFIFLPGGMGTMDELFETLTLLQTKKTRRFPIFLMGTAYWSGLVDWLKNSTLREGFINQLDLDHFKVTDDVDEVVDAIVDWNKKYGKLPTYDIGIQSE